MTGRKKCLVDSVSRTHVQKKKKQTNKPGEIIQYSVLVCLDASMQILDINFYWSKMGPCKIYKYINYKD